MTMNQREKAQEAYEKAKVTEQKQAGTIERHEKQLEKKIAKIKKDHGLDLNGADLPNVVNEYRNAIPGVDLYWELVDIRKKAEDIKSAKKKLIERKSITEKAFERLGQWEKREAIFAELPPIILEFAERYKAQCIEWLLEGAQRYRKALKEIREDQSLDYHSRSIQEGRLIQAYSGSIRDVAREYSEDGRKKVATKISEGNRVDLLKMMSMRITEKCGLVTDAKGLEIGLNGEINGVIIGEKGKAEINTIAAGGWNIQCYHYRVLVKELK